MDSPMLKEARMVSLVLAIVVLAAVVLFSVQNASPAGVSFFVWRFESSLAVIIFLSVVVGIVIGMLFSAGFSWKRKQQKRSRDVQVSPGSGAPPSAPETKP